MLSVMTNNASNIAQNSVNKNNDMLSNAMERLSTGLRINSAADDAAGLQIATRMNANVTGMEAASRNVSDATSMLQTADGALDELGSIATRMKELATQNENGVNDATSKDAINAEFKELGKEMERIMTKTTFNGNNLFDALDSNSAALDSNGAGVTFQIGAGSDEKLSVGIDSNGLKDSISKLVQGLGTGGSATIPSSGEIPGTGGTPSVPTGTVPATSGTPGTPGMGIDTVDALIDAISVERSDLGANINRLSHTASNLSNVTENTKSASGRIMDADFAAETAAMTKSQLLVQAGTNILSSANQNTNLVMGLLG